MEGQLTQVTIRKLQSIFRSFNTATAFNTAPTHPMNFGTVIARTVVLLIPSTTKRASINNIPNGVYDPSRIRTKSTINGKKRVVSFIFQHNTYGLSVNQQQPGVDQLPIRKIPTSPSYCTSTALLLLLHQY